MPRIAPIHQPQDIRFAIAIPPRTMIKITAIGVSHAMMLLCRAVAPVRKGELCAMAAPDLVTTVAASTAIGGVMRLNPTLVNGVISMALSGYRQGTQSQQHLGRPASQVLASFAATFAVALAN